MLPNWLLPTGVPIVLEAQTGILLVGHGTRQPEGSRAFLALCREAAVRAGKVAVEPCFLELGEPAIGRGLTNLARRGVSRAVVVPIQLTAGRHVRHDIPNQVHQALKGLPGLALVFAGHLGSHRGLLELAEIRLGDALAGCEERSSTTVVLVARGSCDMQARSEIFSLARIRRQRDGANDVVGCFLAMSEPVLDDVLPQVILTKPDRVVVQPHLLLPGRLSKRVESIVRDMSARYPQIEWIVAGTLGPDSRLAGFALDLAREGLARLP